jgi:hypothetical protein
MKTIQKISVDSQRFRLEQPISRGGDLGRATPDTDRRGEQQGHPPGLALVPVADLALGVPKTRGGSRVGRRRYTSRAIG